MCALQCNLGPRANCEVFNLQFVVRQVNCAVLDVQCAVFSLSCVACNVYTHTCRVHYAVFSVSCAVRNLQPSVKFV